MAGVLYLVATPIGNLGDLSPRAAETLASVDFIAAEDTRVSVKLLNHLGLKRPLLSYYKQKEAERGQEILSRLLAGESCALVTDAGTPAVSDPGEALVSLCAQNGIQVISVPGPCAMIAALAASGLPTGRFTFEGFLSMNRRSRREHLAQLKGETRTMVFYEAPHKLRSTLQDLNDAFGGARRIALCRELTKLHEEILRMTLAQAAAYYESVPPRGEFVLVLEGAAQQTEHCSMEDGLALVRRLRAEGLSLRDAVRQGAEESGLSKNELYDAARQE